MKSLLCISFSVFAFSYLCGAEMGIKEKLNAEFKKAIASAFTERNFKAAQDLLEQDVDVNTRGQFGETLLMAAAYYGQDKLVHKLLSMRANINAIDNDGATPLSEAISARRLDMIKLLIKNGANPLIEKSGKTASLQLREKVDEFPEDQKKEAFEVLKSLAALEQEYRKTKTVKQMQLPKKAIQANFGGAMGDLGKTVEKYL